MKTFTYLILIASIVFIVAAGMFTIRYWTPGVNGEEILIKPDRIDIDLENQMINFSSSFEMTATVPPNRCNACMEVAGDDFDTQRQCYMLFCR